MIRQATLPLLFVLSPTLRSDPATALERKLRKSLIRRGPIAVGTPAAPYEPRRTQSPLAKILRLEEGREVAITTASPHILREIHLLVELDRRHSVAVRMIVPVAKEDPEPWLRAVRGLAAERIAASVLLSPAPGTHSGEETLRFLLEEAQEAGTLDVEIDAGRLRRSQRAPLISVFQRLRLEYGFPRGSSGRG
jgi:DNA repair photolyase